MAAGVAACGQTYDNLVTGRFDGDKLVAMNWWVGSNSAGYEIDAYADVPDGTDAVFTLNGPQAWTCSRVFRKPSSGAGGGGLFESEKDKLRDKVLALPSFAFGMSGPRGDWKMRVEVSSYGVDFSHTWTLGTGDKVDVLAWFNPDCTQVAQTLAQQRGFVDGYLREMGSELGTIGMRSQSVRPQLEDLLDVTARAKRAGDASTGADERTKQYSAAASSLMKMADLAESTGGLDPYYVRIFTRYPKAAAALLLQKGLG